MSKGKIIASIIVAFCIGMIVEFHFAHFREKKLKATVEFKEKQMDTLYTNILEQNKVIINYRKSIYQLEAVDSNAAKKLFDILGEEN